MHSGDAQDLREGAPLPSSASASRHSGVTTPPSAAPSTRAQGHTREPSRSRHNPFRDPHRSHVPYNFPPYMNPFSPQSPSIAQHAPYGSALSTAVTPTRMPSAAFRQNHPAFPETFRIQTAQQPPPASSSSTQGIKQLTAAQFGATAFAPITLPPIQIGPTWHSQVSVELRVWVVLNSIKAAGFNHLGDFLITAFTERFSHEVSVSRAISAFLHCEGTQGTWPVDIVDAIWTHRKSQRFENGVAEAPTFPSLPRFALPPSTRLLPRPPLSGTPPSTRNALLDLALVHLLKEVDREATVVIRPHHGLTTRQLDLTWSLLTSYTLTEHQETLARNAPALFAVFAAVGTSSNVRKKLEAQATARIEAAAASSLSNPESGQGTTGDENRTSTPANEIEDDTMDGEPKFVRDVWLGVTVTILMLLVFRHQYANLLQKYVAIYLFSTNAHRDVFRMLSRIGLCVSYSTCVETLRELGDQQSEILKEWGRSVKDGSPSFEVVFDNINKARRAWQRTLSKVDQMQNGTAGAVIKLVDVPDGAFNRLAFEEHAKANSRANLTFDDLRNDIDWDHLRGVGTASILRIWLAWIPSLAIHRASVAELFSDKYKKRRLPLRKTEFVSLRCSGIDESTATGANDVIENIVLYQLCILPLWLAEVFLIFCGDQLTVDRIRKLVWYMWKASTPFGRRAFARPAIQLWHLKWAWQKAIIRMHWYKGQEKGTNGLHRDAVLLGRSKYNPDKCDFYPTHHLLRDCFESMVLEALRLVCEEETGIVASPTAHLLENLETYFGTDGVLHNSSFEKLSSFADRVYARYMAVAAHDDVSGYMPYDRHLYGPILDTSTSTPRSEQSSTATQRTSETTARPQDSHESSQKSKSRTSDHEIGPNGDQSLANTVNFMRTVLWYTEIYSAVAEGDIGRVFEVLKVLRFSFWGAGSTNYGNELFELACLFMKEYPLNTRTALMNNYLVNLTGLPGHWHEIDLLMEHLNNWLKNLLVKKTLDFDSPFMQDIISLNLSGFYQLRESFPSTFGLKKASGYHPDADRSADINRLGDRYRVDKVLLLCPGRTQAYVAPNDYLAGMEKVRGGQLETFKARTASQSAGYEYGFSFIDHIPGEQEADNIEHSIDEPIQPIVIDNGIPVLESYQNPA